MADASITFRYDTGEFIECSVSVVAEHPDALDQCANRVRKLFAEVMADQKADDDADNG